MAGTPSSAEHAEQRLSPEGDVASSTSTAKRVQAKRVRHLFIVHNADKISWPRAALSRGSTPNPVNPVATNHITGRPRKADAMLDRSIQSQIGRTLRTYFADIADEPVPERFEKLLEALSAKEKQA